MKDIAPTLAMNGNSEPPVVPPERPRVLFVDDEPRVLEGLALPLRRAYTVETSTNPAEALERVAGGGYAIVVSDLRMPLMDGITFLKRVKEVAPSAGRVLLTGHADVSSAIDAVNGASIHRFLTKPCSPLEMAHALVDVLRSTRALSGEALTRLGRQATLGTMAGSIGHEIGNLVAALGGSLEMVRDQVARGEVPAYEDVSVLELVKMRLSEHARSLTNLSKPRPLCIEDLDVVPVVLGSVEILRKAGVLRMPRVDLDLPDMPTYARADRAALEGALLNVLKNAAEAVAVKGLKEGDDGLDFYRGVVAVRVTKRRGRVAIEIEDNGCGMRPEQLERLFEPFRTTKPATGTGLGLSVVKSSVERQNGTIVVESEPDEGTRFCIELVSADDDDDQRPEPVASGPVRVPRTGTRTRHC